MAEQVAIATNLRHDPAILTLFNTLNGSLTATQPGQPIYVDPYGVILGLPPLGQGYGSPGIQRSSPSFVGGSPPLADRWFSLPDDINFLANGTPDMTATGGTIVERGRRYSWAYMLQRPQAQVDQTVQLTVVVYSARPTDLPIAEPVYQAAPSPPNGIVLGAAAVADLRRGSWILDSTLDATGIVHGDFYRIVNLTDLGNGQTMLEVQPNLRAHATALSVVTIMPKVVEVFDKGTSWQP